MREGKPVTMVMATKGTIEAKCSEKLATILFMVHVVKASPSKKIQVVKLTLHCLGLPTQTIQ